MSQRRTAHSILPEGGGIGPDHLSLEGEITNSIDARARRWVLCALGTITMCLVGTVYGWTTNSFVPLTTGSDDVRLTLTSDEYSWSVSLTVIGSMFGSLQAAHLADRIGRKYCLFICSIMFTLGWYHMYTATTVPMIYFARGILGIGVGISRTINPMFVSEVTDIKSRGSLAVLIAANVYSGSLLAYALGSSLAYTSHLFALVVISSISILPLMCLRETPYFLVAKGQKTQACKSIAYYKGIEDPDKVKVELRALRAEARYGLHEQSRSDLPSQSGSNFPRPYSINLPSPSSSDLPPPYVSNLPSPSSSDLPPPYSSNLPSPSRNDLHPPYRSNLASQSIRETHSEVLSQVHQQPTGELRLQPTQDSFELHVLAPCELESQATNQIHRPSTSELHRPSTSEVHRPSTSEVHRTSTGQIHRPSISEVHRTSTSELHRPYTSQIHRPSTSEVHRPSTSQIIRPSTSEVHRPSTSQIIRPSTREVYRPHTCVIHGPPTCEIHGPPTCEIHGPPTSQILPQTRSALHSRCRSDLHRQFSVDSQASTDIPETYNDVTKYTCLDKLRAILQRSNRKALFIMLGLIMAQQLSGNFTATQYLQELLNREITFINVYNATIWVDIVRIFSGYLTALIVERCGRRKLLILSTLGSCFTLLILATCLLLDRLNIEVSIVSALPVIDLIIYQVMFHIGLGTLPNILLCDLFPTKLKGFVCAIVVIFDGIIGFTASRLNQVITDKLERNTIFVMFGTSCCLAFAMVYLWLPETKGKTYHEIEALLVSENLNSSNAEVRTDEMELRRI